MKKNLKYGLFIALVASTSFGQDAPDPSYEQKLDKIYQSRHASPTDPTEWSMVTSQLSDKTYTTHKGETLRDVSELMFGDPKYWPKIWAMNKEITNPFELPEGTVISFKNSSTDEPPELLLSLVKNLDKPSPDVSPYSLSNTLNAEIPPGSHEKITPIELPPSLPGWKFATPTTEKVIMDLGRPVVNVPAATKNLDYYIGDSRSNAEGEITGTEMSMKSASEFQYIYVKFKSAPTQKIYTVVKDIGEIASSTNGRVPLMTQVQGQIEVLEPVDSAKLLYRAMVRKSLANVEVGGKLITEGLPTYTVQENQNLSSAKAKIVGGSFNQSRFLFGTEGILFLDQGSGDGLTVGQLLPIYQYQGSIGEKNVVRENPRMIGKIQVVKTSDHFATAIVLSAVSEIEIGDGTSPDMRKR